MPPRLRPEVILPLRSSAGWARSLVLSCTAFILLVTAVDAMRYAAQREQRAPARLHHPARAALVPARCADVTSRPR